MATKPTDAVNRINAANGNAYDSINNPGGLAQGGHRQNFVPDLQATVSVAQWSADSATEAAASAVATAADRVQTGLDRNAASNSATAAAGSATAAGNSATAAASTLDEFDDRYLGPKTSDPSKDNDGNTLIVGAIYFNTSDKLMKVWNGTTWQFWTPTAADYLMKVGGTMTGLITFFSSQFASQADAEAGTDSSKIMTAQRVAQAIAKLVAPAKFESALLHIREEYAAGTGGGNVTTNAWNIRTLNTLRTNEIGASLASNVITLSAGTYFVEGSAPGYNAGFHQVRLWNVTDGATTLNGTSESGSNNGVQSQSLISGRFTIAASKQFRLEHFATSAGGGTGTLGNSTSATGAGPAIFSDLKIWKVA